MAIVELMVAGEAWTSVALSAGPSSLLPAAHASLSTPHSSGVSSVDDRGETDALAQRHIPSCVQI